MAFQKNGNSNANIKTVGSGKVLNFPTKQQFTSDGKIWTVRKAYFESGEDFREIVADDGTNEVVPLKSLQKSAAQDGDFEFIKE